MKRERFSVPIIIVCFPVLLVLIEILTGLGSHMNGESGSSGSYDVFAFLNKPLILLIVVFSIVLTIKFSKRVYIMNVQSGRKTFMLLLAFLIIILSAIYGYLRASGKIVFWWDTDGIPKPSTGEYSGKFTLAMNGSAILCLIGYNSYRFIKNIGGSA